MSALPPPLSVTGAILAGGESRRMGGLDKGLCELGGVTLVARAMARLGPQVNRVIISANRNGEVYQRLGVPVVTDATPGFLGPLAGLASALSAAHTPWLATVPCDCPFFPENLVARLATTVRSTGSTIAVVHDGERLQPAFALLRVDLGARLGEYLAQGGRRLDQWFAGVGHAITDFTDRRADFVNVNTPEDLERARLRLGSDGDAHA